ncbi:MULTISPECIES: dTDP-4-dehydrorhamnose 3,5-epimerase family protein [Actinoalloteichus]|uniref:dTDP-4-dehydrorhamnose 3,5-epimerase-like enzyme n=1 Tax=Actinoalloteichus fjordicus TaxID=1612552 RepID=A0AAC9LG37_9PSEU|nr:MULTISPECIES: dTDP-4-dehydrorhamnose 3,5-epimerase [Actinoalloteichus]APU17283.1 dTDP-4-dehydrorhamnose 3,5-epimerase-like enzyme [Actinoalloteichus fjordicus]APU23366.1 dTDP-4-dehydrorhamnose 3,5-epimerase-like enzyme [Actinoalloteichus sp. GBA129-24]
MRVRELSIDGIFEFIPRKFPDSRGSFAAPYQEDVFTEAVGHPLRLGQANNSVSRRGAIRGVHFADVPPGQAKFVYCTRGSILDVAVDLRVGSPTFGHHDTVRLDAESSNSVYLPEGIGHALLALDDDTVVSYLCSEGYRPGHEHGVNPLDPELKLPWPSDIPLLLSDKDRDAPSLNEALAAGLLPDHQTCLEHYGRQRTMVELR